MPRGVGVEIGDNRVRVACAEMAGKRVRLVSFHEEAVVPDEKKPWEDAASEALKKAITQTKAQRARLTASIDSGEATIRELTLPFTNEDQIRKTYRFELESLIHNYAIEDLVCDFFKVGTIEKGTTILAAGVPKKVIERSLKVFQKAGVEPVALDLDVAALFNALVHVGAIDTDEPFLVVYGTARFTKILLVEKKRPRSIRTIRFSFPTPQAAEREQEERKKAREWQTEDLDQPAPIVILTDHDQAKFADLDLEQRSSLIEILAKEISRFLLANASGSTPAHIVLAGEYEIDEAAQMLEAGTQIPVKRLGILDRIDHPFPKGRAGEAGPRVAVALGLALKACDIDELGLDYRRDEFSYGKKFEGLKTTVLVTLELVIVLLAAVALHFHFIGQDLRAAHKNMLDLHEELFKETLPADKLEAPDQAHRQLVDKHRRLVADLGGGDHPIERSALDLANAFFRACYQMQVDFQSRKLEGKEFYYLIDNVKVDQITSGNKGVTLQVTGNIRSVAYAEELRKRVQAVEPFKDPAWQIEIPQFQPNPKDDTQQFTMKIQKADKKS